MKAIPLLGGAVLGFALAIFAAGATAQQAAKNPEVGTWKLDVAKSKYSPGPAPKSNTITMEAAGDGVKYTAKGEGSDGKPTSQEYTAKYDGKDVAITGSPATDMASFKRVDSHTVMRTNKKDGKVMTTAKRVYSKDGKTMTVTIEGKNAKGEKVHNVLHYDRM